MSNPSSETAGRSGDPARAGDTDPTPLDREVEDDTSDASAPANTTSGVGVVGGVTAPVGGLTGVVGGARGAGGSQEVDEGDPEREAFQSGEGEFGASDGPPGGTVRP